MDYRCGNIKSGLDWNTKCNQKANGVMKMKHILTVKDIVKAHFL